MSDTPLTNIAETRYKDWVAKGYRVSSRSDTPPPDGWTIARKLERELAAAFRTAPLKEGVGQEGIADTDAELIEWLRWQADLYSAGDDKMQYKLLHVAARIEALVRERERGMVETSPLDRGR